MKTQAEHKPYVCPITGQLIETTEQALELIRDLQADKVNSSAKTKREISKIRKTFGIEVVELKMPTKGKYWIKMYRGVYNLLGDLNPSTSKLFLFLLDNTHYKDNSVMIDGHYPSQDEIIRLSQISESSVKRGIKDLTDCGLIVSEKQRHIRKIYINPNIAEHGITEVKIHDKFKKG
jgi:hypothetical protein